MTPRPLLGTVKPPAPFNTLAAANSAAGANSIIFLYQGNATYTGGVSMKSGEDLFGQPHGLTVDGYTLVTAGGSDPDDHQHQHRRRRDRPGQQHRRRERHRLGREPLRDQRLRGHRDCDDREQHLYHRWRQQRDHHRHRRNPEPGRHRQHVQQQHRQRDQNNTSHGLVINADGSTDATVSVTGSKLTGNMGDEFQFATDSAATGTDSVTFSNNHVSGVGVDGGGGSGALIEQFGKNTTAITIDGNNIQNVTANGIGVDNEGSGTVSGTINANTVGSATVSQSGGGNSIGIYAESAGTETLAITKNDLYQYDDFAGIYYIDREGNPTLNLTINGNTLADPGGNATIGGAWGILGEGGALTTDAGTVCAAITGNSLTGSGQPNLGSPDVELDQAGLVTYKLPGYTGPSYNAGTGDATAVDSFVASNNSDSASNVLDTSTGPGGFSNTPGGAACPTPSS